MAKRRIWANITIETYHDYKAKCRRLNLKVPEVFSHLVKQWSSNKIELTPDRGYNGEQDGDDKL